MPVAVAPVPAEDSCFSARVNQQRCLLVNWAKRKGAEAEVMDPRAAGSSSDDDCLMRALAAGDKAAFALLLRRHRSWVCALLRAVVRDEEQAEDLTQDVFCRLYERRDEYRPEGRFVAWLKQVAVNVARDFLRARKRAGCASLDSLMEIAAPEEWFDPATIFASRMLQQDVRAAIERLNDEHQAVVLLHYFGGLPVEEIARRLRCPAGTVKSRLFHARRHLRQTLAAARENPPDRPR